MRGKAEIESRGYKGGAARERYLRESECERVKKKEIGSREGQTERGIEREMR